MARISEFNGCCGATIIYEFGFDHDLYRLPSEADKKALEACVCKYITDYHSTRGVGICILNELQIKYGFDKTLRKCGFRKLMGPVLHPGHGRRITVYGVNFEIIRERLKRKSKATLPRKRVFGVKDASGKL